MGGADLDVQVRIADGVADLLEGPPGGEHGEGGGKGHEAGRRGAGRHGHHVALGDAAVEVALGKGLFENGGLGRAGQIRIEDDDVLMLLTERGERAAVAVAGRDLFQFCHVTSPPIPPERL